jgi:hypothetical protein
MRRNLIAQISRLGILGGFGICPELPVEMAQLRLQQVDLLLLPENGAIEYLNQILGQARLDFEFGQAVFHDSIFRVALQMG